MASSTRFLAVMAIAQLASAQRPGAAVPTSPAQIAAAKAAQAAAERAAELTDGFSAYLFIICGSLAAALIVWRVGLETRNHIRKLTCLNNDTQVYFSRPSEKFAAFKKHVLYAPLFRKRHDREFQLSSAVNVGQLPTRFQLAFLVGYLATNVAFCVVSITWSAPFATASRQLRNRTGILAVVNMVCGIAMKGNHVLM